MALPKEAYKELEDIVGPEYISEEPVILDSYSFQYMAELNTPDRGKFLPRPVAVIMPGSTEDVAAIVKTCNRYKIKYKPYSTGWIVQASPVIEGLLQLDLRRMDRILEIDEKNMFAVVEPYVVGATLQAEAMKLGLNCHMIGAGAGCSLLAAATSFSGHGPSSISMGHAAENLLAAEWVMPTGEIISTTGSLSSGAGWFCGEGPGPSIRGIFRGIRGASGEMGVFTKCALRLSPWPGPVVSVEGVPPSYDWPLPETFRAYTLAFPSWKVLADAFYKIWDAEIAYICHRQFNFLGEDLQAAFLNMYIDPHKTLDDLEEFLKKPEVKKLTEEMRRSFQIVLAGNSPNDIDYKEKVLDQILNDIGGKKVVGMSTPAMEKFTLLYLIKMCFKNLNNVYVGSFFNLFGQKASPDFLSSYGEVASELLAEYQKGGTLVDSGGDSMMGCVGAMGDGGYSVWEQFIFYDPHDKESVNGAIEVSEASMKAAAERGWPPGMESDFRLSSLSNEERQLIFGRGMHSFYPRWQGKIKKVLDPNDTGQGVFYITIDEPEE
jgi:glycolate oxidase